MTSKYMYVYIYNVTTSYGPSLVGKPSRCVTQVRFHGTRWASSLAIGPPGPRWPPAKIYNNKPRREV